VAEPSAPSSQAREAPTESAGLDALRAWTSPAIESLCQSIPLPVVLFDRQLRILLRNQAARALLVEAGYVDQILAAGSIDSAYHDWGRELRDMLATRQAVRFDHVHYRSGGQDRVLTIHGHPLVDPAGGEVVGGLLTVQETTAQLTLEKRLAISERLAALGKLAARVAHELNNPLDGILRYINLAMRTTGGPQADALQRYLNEARKGLSRMAQIIGELLEFSRSSYTPFDNANINDFVEDAIKTLEDKAVAQGVKIVSSYHQPMPVVRQANLYQVFCNLIKNAIDAMPNGGTLTISTQIVGRHAVVRFEDTGVGLPEQADRIFEPFFTTKATGKGQGLGLAICKDIVEKHHGQIEARPRPEGGAIFLVRIPVENVEGYAASPEPTGPTGTEQDSEDNRGPDERTHPHRR